MTLLERWNDGKVWECSLDKDEIRRAIAIAQAVEEIPDTIKWRGVEFDLVTAVKVPINLRADELLAKQEEGS